MKSGFHFCKCQIEKDSRKLRVFNNLPVLAKIAGFSLAFFLRMAKLHFDLWRAEAQVYIFGSTSLELALWSIGVIQRHCKR
jgi:hypothetical protein